MALVGVLGILLVILSPVTGSSVAAWWQGDATKPTLQDKADFLIKALPTHLEGITIILVIIVVTALTVSDKIKSEGAISLLSSVVGFVLGKKTAEDAKNNPSTPTTKITSLSITPKVAEVKFGSKLNIKIDPAQEIESYEVQPSAIGKVKIRDQSILVYEAPSKNDAGETTEVIITVTSRTPGIPPASANIQLIEE
jgi:hypothetical protein